MKCKDCTLFIQNKNGVSLCKFNSSWEITEPNNDCPLDRARKPLTCGDCTGIDNDTACMGCIEDDTCPQEGCTMNPFKGEIELHHFLERLEATGYDIAQYLNNQIKEYKLYKKKVKSRYKFQKDKKILNVYIYGDVTYGIKDAMPVWVVVTETSDFCKDYFENQDIIQFTKKEWNMEAKKNSSIFMECVMTLPQYKHKETYIPIYKVNKKKVYEQFTKESQSYWKKGKETFDKDKNARKYIWKAFNLLFFAQNIIIDGRINYMDSLNYYNETEKNKEKWKKFAQHYEAWYERVKATTKNCFSNTKRKI